MSKRLSGNVARPAPIEILVNGAPVTAYEGESLATVLLAAGNLTLSRDASGRPRSPFCNMGVCFDCMVDVEFEGAVSRLRACLTAARPGLQITIAAPSEGEL